MGLKKILFDSGYKEYKRCSKKALLVLAEYDKLVSKYGDARGDNKLALVDENGLNGYQKKTNEFKERYKKGESLDDLLVEAYALVRHAAKYITGMEAFRVQIEGAIAIHGGNIAEMKTGEGKTLTGVFPAYLNALSGDGVHIVTVNEYLAGREANGEIGEIYKELGLTVGLNLRELDYAQKRDVYSCDIIYSTNSELGFDYLRDNMVSSYDRVTQVKGLNYAIIDEVDSILIDDARTPLIISGGEKEDKGLYEKADAFVKGLTEDDYEIDIESRTISLTPDGIDKAEKYFNISKEDGGIYNTQHIDIVHRINNALKAVYIFANGKEYVVSDDHKEVLIVDASTGRILKGRQFSEGLHQALEAKEGVEIKKETITVATITYQNFFRMYKKLSGMTGTAKTEEEEFRDIYNMYVVEVPTNKPVIRVDAPDLLFTSMDFKFKALVEEIKLRHSKGQPILVGTANVETSELVHRMLEKEKLPHEVLNAKNHAREAEIVALAGQEGAITISTNMAGRGTDIKLGEGVANRYDSNGPDSTYNGLAVLGTERFEARRIDNQLRGRSGRQGDPGFSRFFLSVEDDLIMRFGGDAFKMRLASIIRMMGDGDETKPISSKTLAKMVTMAQVKIEGINYDSRKNILKYDDVVRRQREAFYKERQEVVKAENLGPVLENIFKLEISEEVDKFINSSGDFDDTKLANLFNVELIGKSNVIKVEKLREFNDDEQIKKYIFDESISIINSSVERLRGEISTILAPLAQQNPDFNLEETVNKEIQNLYKRLILPTLDYHWTRHIDDMAGFRQGIYLQSYAQANPLDLYKREGYHKFENLNRKINNEIYKNALHDLPNLKVRHAEEQPKEQKFNTNQDLSTTRSNQEIQADRKAKNPFINIKPNDPCPCGSGKKFKYCHGLR